MITNFGHSITSKIICSIMMTACKSITSASIIRFMNPSDVAIDCRQFNFLAANKETILALQVWSET